VRRIKMSKLLFIILVFSLPTLAKRECGQSMKAKTSAQKLAALYSRMNADPNLQRNGSSRIDHVVVPKSVILKLRSQP
jgi:hypothetical protein